MLSEAKDLAKILEETSHKPFFLASAASRYMFDDMPQLQKPGSLPMLKHIGEWKSPTERKLSETKGELDSLLKE
jgi:hypothetical protein